MNTNTHKLTNIKFSSSGLPYLPNLNIQNSFSWGPQYPNMSFLFGEHDEVENSLKTFLQSFNHTKLKDLVCMNPQSLDKIIDVDQHTLDACIAEANDIGVNYVCDAIFTTIPKLTLSVKPADCYISIIEAENTEGKVIGMIHSGFMGTQLQLPLIAIKHLLNKYKVDINSIKIGITPGIKRYFLNVGSNYDLSCWENFYETYDDLIYFDIQGLIIDQYLNAGIDPSRICAYDIDTYERAKDKITFSHRYSKLNNTPEGRMIVLATTL